MMYSLLVSIDINWKSIKYWRKSKYVYFSMHRIFMFIHQVHLHEECMADFVQIKWSNCMFMINLLIVYCFSYMSFSSPVRCVCNIAVSVWFSTLLQLQHTWNYNRFPPEPVAHCGNCSCVSVCSGNGGKGSNSDT